LFYFVAGDLVAVNLVIMLKEVLQCMMLRVM